MVAGGTTDNSIGLDVSCCYQLAAEFSFLLSKLPLLEEPLSFSPFSFGTGCGPRITADCQANLNSTSISYEPMFLNGSLNFCAPVPLYGPFLTTIGTTFSFLYSVIRSSRGHTRGPGTSTLPARRTSSFWICASFFLSRRNSFMLLPYLIFSKSSKLSRPPNSSSA